LRSFRYSDCLDTKNTVLQAARQFLFGTALSRLSGFWRDLTMAYFFGSDPQIATFMVAYRFANLFRRLFGEGCLHASFIPHYESLRSRDPLHAYSFYRDVSLILAVVLIGVIFFFELFFWGLAQLVPPHWQEVLYLSMALTPGLFFICLSALNGAFLQCGQRYFLPAFVPTLFNLIWIGSTIVAYYVCSSMSRVTHVLCGGVILAFFMQWCATFMRTRGLVPARSLREKAALIPFERKQLLKPFLLSVLGIGALQINSAIDAVFARIADLSGPAYLWYAIRIQQLPLALFGIGLSEALLPSLTRVTESEGEYSNLFRGTVRRAMTLMIPCTFAIFTLGASGLDVLYGRGNFTREDLTQTLFCLWGYALSLLPATLTLLFSTGDYAKKIYHRASRASIISLCTNVVLNSFCIFYLGWGAVSIALATSASSWINVWLLSRGHKLGREFWQTAVTMVLLSLGATVGSLTMGYWLGYPLLPSWGADALRFPLGGAMIPFATMGASFLGFVYGGVRVLRIPELFRKSVQ
jgi:putative peptidoglycan lipid II flippase